MARFAQSRSIHTAALYGLMLGVGLTALVFIEHAGAHIEAPAAGPGDAVYAPQRTVNSTNGPLHLLLALPIIILGARLLGAAFGRLGQPPVIGEVLAGIALGPSLLGWAWPAATDYLWPESIGTPLQAIAQIGVVLFMLLVGLELNTRRLRRGAGRTIAVSHASIVVPLVLGAALALWLYPRYSPGGVPFTVFALFMGVSMSVTALPVLARILTDRGIQASPLGHTTLACAAVNDATAWCLLALVVGLARARASDAVLTVGLLLGFVLVMLIVVRPLMGRLTARTERSGQVTRDLVAVVVVTLLICALATEAMGIHALFGAFVLGATIRQGSLLARELDRRLSDLVVVLFLPVFFTYAGLRTQIGLLSGVEDWLVCGLIVAVACAGKLAGSALAARLAGLSWRGAATIGVLMNTRGLMELIVLNVGLDLGVLSPKLFTMLVIMAIVTTVITSPILTLLTRGRGAGVLAETLGADPEGSDRVDH